MKDVEVGDETPDFKKELLPELKNEYHVNGNGSPQKLIDDSGSHGRKEDEEQQQQDGPWSFAIAVASFVAQVTFSMLIVGFIQKTVIIVSGYKHWHSKKQHSKF